MSRLHSIVLCAALSAGTLACGSNGMAGSGGNGSGGNGSGGSGSGGSGTGGGGTGGGGSPTDHVLAAFPLNNEVSGWTVDPSVPKTAVARAVTASTEIEAERLIDGAAAPFFASPFTPTLFAWQNYVNASLPSAPPDPQFSPEGATVVLYIWQMPSSNQASSLYAKLLTYSEYNRKAGTSDDWQDPMTPALADDSRIQDTSSAWWINFRKGVYYVEVKLDPSCGPGPDYDPGNAANKAEAIRFAQWVANKL